MGVQYILLQKDREQRERERVTYTLGTQKRKSLWPVVGLESGAARIQEFTVRVKRNK